MFSFQSKNTDLPDHCKTTVNDYYEEIEDSSKLGTLSFTLKTALIVTINKCSNMQAKDSVSKTWFLKNKKTFMCIVSLLQFVILCANFRVICQIYISVVLMNDVVELHAGFIIALRAWIRF